MRLLHFDDSGRLFLRDFRGKTIPPYAILSHRWGDSEILFEDVGSEAYKQKDGYQKLEFCAKQAAQDNLKYFWIDTCCIDRWDLRERSKAINSMFRWYKNATRCYVYLPDVLVPTAIEAHQQSDWEESFRASKWFTRGWTLQELIAPASVEFFSCEGKRIGDKTSLEQLVHEITSIPLTALQNCPLDQFTIHERMQWAEHRDTTEQEDIVYCLLGILDVFMPISYGEGKEKALRRLQVELEASSAPSIIPYSRNDQFVGRQSQLAELETKLFSDKQNTTLAIVGPGGTGKSQLALELAYRTKENDKNCSVFWIDASNLDSIHQSYASIAQKLDIPGWDNEKADLKQLIKLHLEGKGARPCLFIFDNADDITLVSGRLSTARTASVIDYIPQSILCSIVFTTTESDIAEEVALQSLVKLRELTPDTAQSMLENYLNNPVPESDYHEAKHLLQELSYLPLAIVQAAAYINTRDMTLRDYRSQLEVRMGQAPKRSNESSENKLQEHSTQNPVAITLYLSVDQLYKDNKLAADCLFLAACLDRKDIPLDLFEASSLKDREDAVKLLGRYALITRRPADSSLDIHRLVHHALREWLQDQEQLDQWIHNTMMQLVQVFPDNNHGNRSMRRRLLPHARYILSNSPAEREEGYRLTLVDRYAMTLYSDGRYSEAEELQVQVIEIRKRVLGEEHPATLTSMHNLALTYGDQGRWKEAEELQVQVIEIKKRVLGEEHPDTLASINNLALTYRDQGRWKEAEELHVQALEIEKRVLGEEHPNTLTSMNNLASTYSDQGRWKEAEELQLQVLEIEKRVLGEEHPNTLTSMHNLAITYGDQGRWKEAEELHVQALEIEKRVLGEEHPGTLTSMNNLASTYGDQGRWKEAEELQVQALEIEKRVLGEEHPGTLTSITNLASTYRDQGRWKEAEELEVQALEIEKRVLGEEHPGTLTSMNNLASTYGDQGRWKEAEELEVQALEIRRRVHGEEHPGTLTSMNNLAYTLESQGRYEEAIALMETCFPLRKRVLGSRHPDTESSLGTLTKWHGNRWRLV
jgi:tetratricopeptide (TPR) repeat protein